MTTSPRDEGVFGRAVVQVAPLDDAAVRAALDRHPTLTKPPGSLGRLERLGVQLAGITGRCPPPVPGEPAVAVFAADHGVVAAGVTPWPQEVTAQMVANFAAGGAAINAIARQVGAAVRVVDVGVNGDVSALECVDHRKIRPGTADLSAGPALNGQEVEAALDAGAAVAADLVAAGHDLLVTGDMGIGNTTASAAVIGALTGADAAKVTGRGTGIEDAMLARKTDIVRAAIARVADPADARATLAEVGGLEIAAIAGFIVGAAATRTPVIVDGVIALAGLLAAEGIAPGLADLCIAGHRSTEPGASVALEHLGLDPVLDLELRLGEGTGACLAVPIIQAAARILGEMATFDDAGVGRTSAAQEHYRAHMATRTRAFGAGNRESHDASDFYARFHEPELSDDDMVNPCTAADTIVCGDARAMTAVDDASVALVVTSPPYFAGKEYEQALGEGHIPGTYVEFLAMLRDVFAECKRVLEPGGRIAVNVANLGRKPYRSLSGDVLQILQDDLGLLPRGEIIWQKAKGATGSIAVGSYLSASNPVIRDITERVVVASKGRFDRAVPRKEREKLGMPFENTITKERFFESTLDVWEIRPEHARKIGHPAPFPVELPERLLQLYTYRGDVVLDPFLGSGSTAVAAVRNDRRYVGYDTDPEYVELAERRVAEERAGQTAD